MPGSRLDTTPEGRIRGFCAEGPAGAEELAGAEDIAGAEAIASVGNEMMVF